MWHWLSVWSEVQTFCIWSSWCHCIAKPHHLLPHLNPYWFYLSGTGLHRLCWKRGHSTGIVVVVGWAQCVINNNIFVTIQPKWDKLSVEVIREWCYGPSQLCIYANDDNNQNEENTANTSALISNQKIITCERMWFPTTMWGICEWHWTASRANCTHITFIYNTWTIYH